MHVQTPLTPFTLPPTLPALHRLLLPAEVIDGIEKARQAGTGPSFAARLLDCLDIRFTIRDGDLARIPARGPAIAVANHPYGILEGLILMVMLERVRPDFKLLANSWLGCIPEMRPHMVLVNPFETAEAVVENRPGVRTAVRCLGGGGMLAVFPAGEVAHVDWKAQCITDPPWKTTAARLALRARCGVVPVFFEGANSIPFQLAGILHPGLRTASLAIEFCKMRGKTVRVRAGSPIPYAALAEYRDPKRATAYLRHRTFSLANRSEFATGRTSCSSPGEAVAQPASQEPLAEEIAALPAECELAGDRNFAVYLASAEQIPLMLNEIGRCRELAFRSVGEGTGAPLDLDRFDGIISICFSGTGWIAGLPEHTGSRSPATCSPATEYPVSTRARYFDFIPISSNGSDRRSSWGGPSWFRIIKRIMRRCSFSGRGLPVRSNAVRKRLFCSAPPASVRNTPRYRAA